MDRGADCYLCFLDGDNDAFVEIIRDYKDGLILYLDSFTHDLTAAEELMEDTFVKLVTKRPVFYRGASFKTWLYAIAGNTARDWLRRKNRHREIPMEELPEELTAREGPELQHLRQEERTALRRALRKLRGEYAQVLYLTYFEGFTNGEAAAVMRKNRRQIENLVYRAKQALRAQLEKEGFCYEEL